MVMQIPDYASTTMMVLYPSQLFDAATDYHAAAVYVRSQ